MKAIPDAVRPHLPPTLRDFQWHARAWLVQIHYGQPALHYEIWSMAYRDLLELGLHFEQRDPAANARLLAYFDAHAIAIKAELGERVEVEPWDKGWAKVYETWPLEPFELPFVEKVASRLAQMIAYLQPLLDGFKDSAGF